MKDLIKPGSCVTLHFALHLQDGTLVDSSQRDTPLSLVIGDGSLLAGLTDCLIGLQAGDVRSFELPPQEIPGPMQEEAVHHLPRGDFPEDMQLAPGLVIGFEMPSGEEVPGVIQSLNATQVVVDFSHPLQGHGLRFDVEIITVDAT